MTTFNDAIKDETQITDEKIVEYGQTIKVWLEEELANCAKVHQQDFNDGIKRIDRIVAGELEDPNIFGYTYEVAKGDRYQVEYDKRLSALTISLTLVIPDDIITLFKIGSYINLQLLIRQFDYVSLKVKKENGDGLLIDTGFSYRRADNNENGSSRIILDEQRHLSGETK